MQVASGAVEVVEPETELVLVAGRRIDAGELFWPEDDALYLLASTWEAVDPRENGKDSISGAMMVDPESGDLTHKAAQELVQLTFTTQPGGLLWRAVGFLGASEIFKDTLPSLGAFLSQQKALGARFSLVLLYDVAEEPEMVNAFRYSLAGCAMAADVPFAAIP